MATENQNNGSQGNRPANNGTTIFSGVYSFYDDACSSLKVGYRTDQNWVTIGYFEMAPILADQKGQPTERGVQKYNYEAKAFCPIYPNVANDLLRAIHAKTGEITVSAQKKLVIDVASNFEDFENGLMLILENSDTSNPKVPKEVYHYFKDEFEIEIFASYLKEVIKTAISASGHIIHAVSVLGGKAAATPSRPVAAGPARRNGPTTSTPSNTMPQENKAGVNALDEFANSSNDAPSDSEGNW